MKKNNTGILGLKDSIKAAAARKKAKKQEAKTGAEQVTIGLDLGDKTSRYCVLNNEGEVVKEGSVATTRKGMLEGFGSLDRCLIVLEVGTHSPWVSRLLSGVGHEVLVANARKVKAIYENSKKNDRVDAHMLARLARIDPSVLHPIQHRGEQAHLDLLEIRSRAALVETRTKVINSARGLMKALGERLPHCDADQMGVKQMKALPAAVQETLRPMLETVELLTQKIHLYDERIEQIARTKYPETKLLQQVKGVGTLIALTFVLTVDDPDRFRHSRDVGCYVGLRPKQDDSGESRKQLQITKCSSTGGTMIGRSFRSPEFRPRTATPLVRCAIQDCALGVLSASQTNSGCSPLTAMRAVSCVMFAPWRAAGTIARRPT